MDFELSKEQREVKERAAEFADREVAPYAAEWDREARFPKEVYEGTSKIQRLILSRSITRELAEKPGGIQSSRPVVG